MKVHVSHPVFDIESEIIKTGNAPCPVDLKSFQERIDRALGKMPDGKPKVRVVWGQAATQFVMGRQRMKYPFYRYMEGGEIQDIGTPRFYFEELHTNAELQTQGRWEQARWAWIDGEKVDLLGPIPEDGFYSPLFAIAHHDDYCCGGREFIRGEPCLGAYRPPTDSDITRLQRMHKRKEQASRHELDPTPEQVTKAAAEMAEKRDEQFRSNIREVIEDYIKTRSHSWDTLDPAVLQHGKYHWLRSSRKSGLTDEEIKQLGKKDQDGRNSTAVSAGSLATDR